MEECNSQMHSETDIPLVNRIACIYITSSAARSTHAHGV